MTNAGIVPIYSISPRHEFSQHESISFLQHRYDVCQPDRPEPRRGTGRTVA